MNDSPAVRTSTDSRPGRCRGHELIRTGAHATTTSTDLKVEGSSPRAPGQRPLLVLEWPFLLPTLLPKPLASGSEQLVYGVGCLLAKHRQDVRVGVHRDANFRVPEYLHDDPIRNALGK